MAFKLGSKRGNSDKKLNFRGTSDDYVASDVQHNENNQDGTFTPGPQ